MVMYLIAICKKQTKYTHSSLSNTHNKHRSLQNLQFADVIIHSDDVSFAGSEDLVTDLIGWFAAIRGVFS